MARHFIVQHFEKALQRGWLPYFSQAALKYDFPLALLLALASRETNMTNMKGDFRVSKYFPNGGYHGYGILQVDIGTDAQWIASGAWQRIDEAIMHGTKILASKRDELNRMWTSSRTIKNFLWVLAASYNHGTVGSFNDFKVHGSPDLHTTGHDYGEDVVGRMAEFQTLLDQHSITATSSAVQATANFAAIPQQQTGAPDPAAQSAPVGAIIQTGEGNVADTGVTPQPVEGGGAGDKPTELATSAPVKSGGVKAIIAAIFASIWAGIQFFGIQARETYDTAKGAFADNPLMMVVVICTFVTGIVIYWKYQDRLTQLDKQREQQAHERDLANQQVMADPKQINVEIKPPVPPNQQP